MSDIDDQLDVLSDKPFFRELEAEKLRDLLEVCEPRRLMTGEALWATGDRGEAAFILMSGRIEISWRAQPHGRRERQVSQPGALVGLAYLVHGWEHESAAFPVEQAEALRLEREEFREMFNEEHPAAYRLVDAVAEKLVDEVRDANQRLHEVFGHPAETLRMLRRRARKSERR